MRAAKPDPIADQALTLGLGIPEEIPKPVGLPAAGSTRPQIFSTTGSKAGWHGFPARLHAGDPPAPQLRAAPSRLAPARPPRPPPPRPPGAGSSCPRPARAPPVTRLCGYRGTRAKAGLAPYIQAVTNDVRGSTLTPS